MNATWLQRAVATNLRALRQFRLEEEHGGSRSRYSAAATAKAVGISETTYRALEQGATPLSLDRLLQLARHLDVSPLDLVSPPLGERYVQVESAARNRKPQPRFRVEIDDFILWWRGTRRLGEQNRVRWHSGRGYRRSDPGFADARFGDAETRVEGRASGRDVEPGRKMTAEPMELPERGRVHAILEQYWEACQQRDDDAAYRLEDDLFDALQTGRRRVQGVQEPEWPLWAGKRLPVLPE